VTQTGNRRDVALARMIAGVLYRMRAAVLGFTRPQPRRVDTRTWQPIPRDFVDVALELFGFLVTEHRFIERVVPDGPEVWVHLIGPKVAFEIMLEDDGWITIDVVPIHKGKTPEYFDLHLRDQYRGFPLELFFEKVDPEWIRPPHPKVRSAQDIRSELAPYARELASHGGPLLAGDAALFAEMKGRVRSRLIEIHLDNWKRFVERIRSGFDGPISEYVSGIVARAQLETFQTVWSGPTADDPVDAIHQTDALFDQFTEPLKWGGGANVVLPSPAARRWWRRPKWLVGTLRDYFSKYT
jgi:hypothetical protein